MLRIMEIREATEADWPAIWPFFHQIVTAGETYAYDQTLTEEQGRAIWMHPSTATKSRTVVAVDADGTVLGSANMYRTGRGRARMSPAAASWWTPPAAVKESGARCAKT